MRKLLFILFCSIYFFGFSQQDYADNLKSPHQAVYTHLHYLESEYYNDTLAAAPFKSNNRTDEIAIALAIKLKQIIDGEGYQPG